MWAGGICVNAGLEPTKATLLVLIAGLADGTKAVLAVESGHRGAKADTHGGSHAFSLVTGVAIPINR
jgi:hypothetical protein